MRPVLVLNQPLGKRFLRQETRNRTC